MPSYIIYVFIILIVLYLVKKLRTETTLNENKKEIDKLLKDNYLITISILPIFTENNDSYKKYYKVINYLDKISQSSDIFRRNKMSIKIGQLADNDEDRWNKFLNLVDYANQKNIFIWISAITKNTLDQEYHYYKRLRQLGYKNIGITLAAYNSSVSKKIDYILSEKGHVRLVKGIYEGNIHDEKLIDILYLKNSIKLIDSGYYHTIATHDFTIIKTLLKYKKLFNNYIEIGHFYNSFSFSKNNYDKLPIKLKFVSFYLPHGKYYPFIRDNIGLYSFQNKLYIVGAKINGLFYDLISFIN